MPDLTAPLSNGDGSTEPKKTLRETLEAAWDTVVENAPDEPSGDEPQPAVDNQGQPRDEHGRFVARATEPGEAEQRPQQAEHPAPPETPQQPQPPHPAPPPGEAAQAPANWSAEDRAAYGRLPQEGQAFLLRRHSEMEGEFQRRMQAGAAAANFAHSLAPIANDPVIAGSLREAGVSFGEAINQWAGFHRRFITDPVNMLRELVQRAGVDPAVLASTPPAGGPSALPPEIAKDPGLKLIADHLGRTNSDMIAMRNELQAMRADTQQRQNAEVMRVTRWGIDSFAEEKDAQGNLLHPHFDAVLPQVIELFKANPRRDLREAYETALWMHSDTRQGMLQQQRSQLERQQSDQRAAQQVRSNARGRTHPVTPPPRPEGSKRSLREALEEAADKVGLE